MSNNDIFIRKAEIDDIPAILEIENASFTDPWTKSMFEAHFDSKTGVSFVAESNGEICGFINAYVIDASPMQNDGECEIANIAVSHKFKRMHIGDKLACHVLELAKSKRCDKVFLEVRESNEGAKALYTKNGFTVYGVRKNYYSNPREDAILMSCDI